MKKNSYPYNRVIYISNDPFSEHRIFSERQIFRYKIDNNCTIYIAIVKFEYSIVISDKDGVFLRGNNRIKPTLINDIINMFSPDIKRQIKLKQILAK